MREIGVGLTLVVVLGGCLSGGQVSSSTGNSIGSGSGSGGNGTAGAPSTAGSAAAGGTSSGAGTSGTTGSATGGGGCLTAADCSAGDVCLDGGCGAPILPSLNCIGVGLTCGAGSPPCCQGVCGDGGFCTAWSNCAVIGQPCQGTSDCCENEVCQAGACASACGYLATLCAHDGDCCSALGLVCRPPKVPDGNPLECVSLPVGDGVSCTPARTATTPECNLGTGCLIAGGVDPCIPAGYICDTFYGACREPERFEECVPGGPPCQGFADSSLAALQCIYVPFLGYGECLQPCVETSDCLAYADSCQSINGVPGNACFGNYGCTDDFLSCNAESFGDGTCVPVKTSTGIQGICDQAAPDAGPLCNHSLNRQEGGFCGVGQACIGGVCTDLCNAGTGPGGPACGGNCIPFGPVTDPDDEGICETQDCDFTESDGGGCLPVDGTPLKCIPAFVDGFPDNGEGFCVQAVVDPPALGAPCSQQDPLHVDSCGAGQACAALGDSQVICVQLCKGPGTQSNCPAGKSCQNWYADGVASSIMGLCN